MRHKEMFVVNIRKPGFTVMELITVIATILVLAVLLFPILRVAKRKSDAKHRAEQTNAFLVMPSTNLVTTNK